MKRMLLSKLLDTNDFDDLLTQEELFYLGTLVNKDLQDHGEYEDN